MFQAGAACCRSPYELSLSPFITTDTFSYAEQFVNQTFSAVQYDGELI